jgi:hypothetical protein
MIGQKSMNLLERLGGIIEMGQRLAKRTTHKQGGQMRTVTALILILAGSLFTEALAQENVTQQKPSTELDVFLQTRGHIIVADPSLSMNSLDTLKTFSERSLEYLNSH